MIGVLYWKRWNGINTIECWYFDRVGSFPFGVVLEPTEQFWLFPWVAQEMCWGEDHAR